MRLDVYGEIVEGQLYVLGWLVLDLVEGYQYYTRRDAIVRGILDEPPLEVVEMFA